MRSRPLLALLLLSLTLLFGPALGQDDDNEEETKPFGIPDDAIAFKYSKSAPVEAAGARFGYAMDSAWPIVAITEYSEDSETGQVHVFAINTNSTTEELIRVASLWVPSDPSRLHVGTAVAVSKTGLADFGHTSYEFPTLWTIAVPGDLATGKKLTKNSAFI